MRNLVSAIIAALFAVVTTSVLAADPVKTDPNPGAKPGRQIDDAVKTDPSKSVAKPGRAADEPAPAGDGKKKKKKKKKAE